MNFCALVSIEGVLAAEHKGAYTAMNPITSGLHLFNGLKSSGRVLFSSTHDDKEAIEYWLKVTGIAPQDYQKLYIREYRDKDKDDASLRLHHLNRARAAGYPLSLFVDSNPLVVSRAFASGVVTLLCAHPQYMRPEFRPDAESKVRLWELVDEEISRQRELLTEDPRKHNEWL